MKIRVISCWHIHIDNVALPPVSFQFITLGIGIGSICVNLHSEFVEKQIAVFFVVKLDFTTEDSLH